MRVIKKETDYALRALFFIKNNGGHADVSKIYSNMDIPRPFLRRILQQLAHAKILLSKKGKHGGFKFLRPFEKITLARLNEIFDKRLPPGECPFKNKVCINYKTCVLKGKLSKLEEEIYKMFENILIKDLWM